MHGLPAGVALVAAAFIGGAIPWGYIAGRHSGVDLRTVGSGGTGATNVLRTLGGKASALVVALDFLKGLVPVVSATHLGFSDWWTAAAAVAAVAGHCWSPFIRFKGGKGVATGAGAAIALLPQALLVVPVMGILVWRTRYVSLGSLVSTGLVALFATGAALAGRLSWSSATAILLIAAIITFRHAANIDRLFHGTERRFGERVTV